MSRGSLLGGYLLLEPLGSGVLTRTFTARSAADGSAAVAKLLHSELAEDPDLVERYSSAANRLTTLTHPNIARVLCVGPHHSRVNTPPFLIVERCAGSPLRASLGRGALPLHVACQIGVQVCRALLAAHACGVIHRDLTPQNVMLSWQRSGAPRVKVTDFGLAWAAFEGHPSHEAVRWGSRTPRYSAPEVLTGLPADERADVYSLAAILYEALSGVPLIDTRDELLALQRALTGQHAPLASHDPSLPRPLVERIEQALAVDPDRRLSGLRELLAVLVPFADEGHARSTTTLGPHGPSEAGNESSDSIASARRRHERGAELSDRVAYRMAPEERAAVQQLLEPVFPKSPRTPRIALNLEPGDLESIGMPPSLPPPVPQPSDKPRSSGAPQPASSQDKRLDWLAITAGLGIGAALLLLAF